MAQESGPSIDRRSAFSAWWIGCLLFTGCSGGSDASGTDASPSSTADARETESAEPDLATAPDAAPSTPDLAVPPDTAATTPELGARPDTIPASPDVVSSPDAPAAPDVKVAADTTPAAPDVKVAADTTPAAPDVKVSADTAPALAWPSGKYISVDEVQAHLQAGDPDLLLVNVVDEEFYDLGFVPGSLKIPWDTLASRLAEVDRQRHVVVYCRKGVRSESAYTTLVDAGYPLLWVMEGGIERWIAAGYPTVPE